MKKDFITIILCLFLYLIQNKLNAQEVKIFISAQDSVLVTALRDHPIPQYSSVATKLYIPIQQIPMSVGVVNNALINNQNTFVLGDALRNISSVNTQTGFGVHDYFIIRGFNSLDNALILIDGTPEPEVTYYNLYNIDRVEILKGSGAFLYGSNPLSGTVNLYRKQPLFSNFLDFNTTYGQFGTSRYTLDAGFGDPGKKLAARINALYEHADNYRDDKTNRVVAVNPSMTTYLGRMTVNLNLEYINSQYKPDTGLPLLFDLTTQQLNRLPDVPRTTSYQAPFDRSDQKIARFKLSLHQKFNAVLTFQSQFYFTRLDWDSQGTLLNGAYPNLTGSMDVYRSLSYLEDDRDLFGNQTELVWSFHTGPLTHYLLTGFEWNILQENYRYDNVPVLSPVDLYNPVETAVESNLVFYPYLRGDVENRVIAPYIVDQVTLSDRMQVTGGLRYDMIAFQNKADGYLTDRQFKNMSPMIGVHYSPVPEVSFYANSGGAYAPPSSQVVGDQDAEKSIQYEAGMKQRYFNGSVHLDFSYYHIEKENIAIPGNDGILRQLGNQRSRGIELQLQMEPVVNWFTFICYAYSDVELTEFRENVPVGQDEWGRPIEMVFDRSGNDPAFTPEHILNVWTTKEFRNGLGLGGGVRYISSQYIDEDNVFQIDPALIFDAIVYFKWHRFKFSINLKNISNEEYEVRGFNNSSVVPAASRSIYGNVDLSI